MKSLDLVITVFLALAFVSCDRAKGPGERTQQPEYEHLENAKVFLHEAKANEAGQELANFEALAGESSDLLFHRARLLLLQTAGTPRTREAQIQIAELLGRVANGSSHDVQAHRLLFELEKRWGNLREAEIHRREIVRRYGLLGELEMMTLGSLNRGEPRVFLTPAELNMTGGADLEAFIRGVQRLRRGNGYSPQEAVKEIEQIFERYPELATLRYLYAKYLVIGQVRLLSDISKDRAHPSSKVALDLAVEHLKDTFDQLDPTSETAQQIIQWLARIALRTADFDAALSYINRALNATQELPITDRHRLMGQKAVSLYKTDRFAEVVDVLTPLLSNLPEKKEIGNRWLLHLAHEKLGTPTHERREAFTFRADISSSAPTHLKFEDIAAELGIDKLDGYGPNAWGDYDGDGDFDLFASGGETYSTLYRNDGDRFTNVSQQSGLVRVRSSFSSTFADIDNDGWPELYLGRDGWAGRGPNTLYHNNGNGTFSDVTSVSGLGNNDDSFVHTWSDVDRDGFIDLFITNGITLSGSINKFFHNDGDGTFSEVTSKVGLAESPGKRTIGAAFADYNLDGWPDLFVSGYLDLNRLYRNRGDGTFDEVAMEAGVAGTDHLSTGYVCFFMDLNNDGWPDILRTNLAPWSEVLLALSDQYDNLSEAQRLQLAGNGPKLYRNNGDGTFSEESIAAGLMHPVGNMGANLADVDNDGWIDLYFGTGDPSLARMEADRFYHGDGDGTFTERTFAAGLGHSGKGHGITFIDLDEDGDLEIYAAEGGMVFGDMWRNALYFNHQKSGNHWIHVDLRGVTSNRDGIGAKVIVEIGGIKQMKERRNGVGFGSSDSPTIEFGLGEATKIDRLSVWWPSGLNQSFSDVVVDQRVLLVEGMPIEYGHTGEIQEDVPNGGL